MKILFVDDSPSMRAIVCEQISETGHDVDAVGSGFAALEYLKQDIPDLILLDVTMPEMDGYTAAAKIREYLQDDWIPIIFLSANVEDKNIAEGIQHGGDDYLTKPVSNIVLKAKLTAMERLARMRKNLISLSEKVDQANGKLLEIALIDELTGIANRRCFNQSLDRIWQHAINNNEPVALMMIDVDHFKTYNDTNGHQEGDVCLQQVSKILESSLLHRMDLACRYGGEEFSAILPNTDLAGCLLVAERIRHNIESANIQYNNDKLPGPLTASIGCVSLSTKECSDYHELIRIADAALYEAKRLGRNQVYRYENPLEHVA